MSPGQQKWGDRTFMNMMEQAPIFFAALWSHAFFCSAKVATGLGMIYLGLRECSGIRTDGMRIGGAQSSGAKPRRFRPVLRFLYAH